jgi:hypothetical protein
MNIFTAVRTSKLKRMKYFGPQEAREGSSVGRGVDGRILLKIFFSEECGVRM